MMIPLNPFDRNLGHVTEVHIRRNGRDLYERARVRARGGSFPAMRVYFHRLDTAAKVGAIPVPQNRVDNGLRQMASDSKSKNFV